MTPNMLEPPFSHMTWASNLSIHFVPCDLRHRSSAVAGILWPGAARRAPNIYCRSLGWRAATLPRISTGRLHGNRTRGWNPPPSLWIGPAVVLAWVFMRRRAASPYKPARVESLLLLWLCVYLQWWQKYSHTSTWVLRGLVIRLLHFLSLITTVFGVFIYIRNLYIFFILHCLYASLICNRNIPWI